MHIPADDTRYTGYDSIVRPTYNQCYVLPDIRSVVRDVEFGACVEILFSSADRRRYALKTTPEPCTST